MGKNDSPLASPSVVPPGLELVGFAPCVPFKGPEDDVEEGILMLDARRMSGCRAELDEDWTLTITLPSGRVQVFPKGLASLLFDKPRVR